MRTILIILAAVFGLAASGATNEPTIQMLATTNGVVKLPTNITSVRIGGTVFTNLLGFGLAVSNNQLSVDTTQLPAGGGGGGSGTVTSVGASTTVSGLGFSGSPVTESGTLSLTGTVAVASGGTGATDASGARTALSLVPGADVQAYDVDLAAIAALANSGIIVRTGSGTVAARTITGDSEAVVSNGDGVSGNPTLSIGSAITRDSELTAALLGETWHFGPGSPIDGFWDNGDYYFDEDTGGVWLKAAGTWTLQSNFQTVGGTNIIAHLATKAPLASPAFTTSATIGGTNVLDYAATHLTEAEASAMYHRTNSVLTRVAGIGAGTEGDLIYRDSVGWTNLSKGTQGQFLAITATVPAWSNAPSGGGTWDGTPIASGTITNLFFDQLNGSPRYGVYLYDEFLDSSTTRFGSHYNASATASGGAITASSSAILGGLLLRAGTSSTGSAVVSGSMGVWALTLFTNLLHECRVSVVNASDSTNSYVFQWGFGDGTSTNNVDGVFFEHNANTPNWVVTCVNNSTASSNVTSTAVSSANVVLSMYYNLVATNVIFSINRTPVWTNANNVPSSRQLGFRAAAIRSNGSTQREINIDWMRTIGNFVAER